MKRGLNDRSAYWDEEVSSSMWRHLDDIMDRGPGKPRDVSLVSRSLGVRPGTMRERARKHTPWSLGEVIAAHESGLLDDGTRWMILDALGADTPEVDPAGGATADPLASARPCCLEYNRDRHVIVAVDGSGRAVAWTRTPRSWPHAAVKVVRALCAYTTRFLEHVHETETDDEEE